MKCFACGKPEGVWHHCDRRDCPPVTGSPAGQVWPIVGAWLWVVGLVACIVAWYFAAMLVIAALF